MYGLIDTQIAEIKNIFVQHPDVVQVFIYGSRVKGNYKPGSDIDLAFTGTVINSTVLNKINISLDDLLLPYKYDLTIFDKIFNDDLIAHIKRAGIIIYDKNFEIEL